MDLGGDEGDRINLSKWSKVFAERPELVAQEGYLKWVADTAEDLNSSDIAQTLSIRKTDDYEEISAWKTESSLEYVFFDVFYVELEMVFMYSMLKHHTDCKKALQSAKDCLQKFKNIVRNPIIHTKEQEHLVGAEFVLKSLKNLVELLLEVKLELDEAELDFDLLHPKSQAFIYAIKAKFYGGAGSWGKVDAIRNLSLQLDPDHWEWCNEKYKEVRWKRKQQEDFCLKSTPNEKEKTLIERAYHLNPHHPVCLQHTARYLGERIKGIYMSRSQRKEFPFLFDEIIFKDVHSIIKFIKEKSMEFFSEFPNYSSGMNNFGKFFSSDLPKEIRDQTLAMKFLSQGLSVTPNSSKLNHRMGIFYIQGLNFDLAENYLTKAVELNMRNGVAALDLVQVYMRDPFKNEEKLMKIFEQSIVMHTKKWTPAEIVFLNGYFLYLHGRTSSAVRIWGIWTSLPKYSKAVRYNSFKDLEKLGNRFNWQRKNFQLEAQDIKQRIQEYGTQIDTEAFTKLLSEIEKAVQRTRWS